LTELYWDGSFQIAAHLKAAHPNVDLNDITLQQIYEWTVALPEFADDPSLANQELLEAIYSEWFEEVNPL
jgi:FeS assembly protein IscX